MKPLSDYQIPGTTLLNFSKWSRENIPKEPPKFKVGDRVVLKSPLVVVRVGEDCDGTPLFSVAFGLHDPPLCSLHGIGSGALEPVSNEDEEC